MKNWAPTHPLSHCGEEETGVPRDYTGASPATEERKISVIRQGDFLGQNNPQAPT